VALKHYSDAVSASAMVELYQELDRADHFVIVAQWPDQAAYAAQKSGAAATELAGALKTLQSAPPDTHVFQVYSSGPLHLPMGGRARLYGIGEFEVAAGKTGDVAAMLTPLADMSREDPGEMRYDILQEEAPRQNRFVILDAWSSPQDFEKHRTASHMVKFRDGLAPLMTAAFEDRVYGKFN
jgi:quinol monooxygenase YgiN